MPEADKLEELGRFKDYSSSRYVQISNIIDDGRKLEVFHSRKLEVLISFLGAVFEPSLASGRPDSVVKTEKAIYIVEFKYAQSAAAALAQCREKRYADAYQSDGRRVVYVGVNYDPATRTIGDVKCENAL